MLRHDDQELTAESVARPDLRVAAIVPPPLIAVAGRVRVARRDVVDATRRRITRPAGGENPRAAPDAIVNVQLADLRKVERLEIESALGIGVSRRRLFPVKVSNP